MSNNDKIRLKYKLADGYVDLSKPFDTDKLYYEVVADNDVQPDKENTLYLTIRGKCFNEIMSGEKTVEYRGIKDTTYRKYLQIDGRGISIYAMIFPRWTSLWICITTVIFLFFPNLINT